MEKCARITAGQKNIWKVIFVATCIPHGLIDSKSDLTNQTELATLRDTQDTLSHFTRKRPSNQFGETTLQPKLKELVSFYV